MKLELEPAYWHAADPLPDFKDLAGVLVDGVWSEAARRFHEKRQSQIAAGRPAPKGAQAFINHVIGERLVSAGWAWDRGRASRNQVWVRFSFRHQMSLGSDLWEALQCHITGRFSQVAVIMADEGFLEVITPNDAKALCSFSKLQRSVRESHPPCEFPLFLGRLLPASEPPSEVEAALRFLPRLRDRGVPVGY